MDDDIVLSSMPLRKGTDKTTLSRFVDDVWDMSPSMFHPTRKAFLSVDFRAISCPVERLTAKEYIFAWLNERIPDREPRLRPLSSNTALAMLRRFMSFAREQIGRFDMTAIDQELVDAYAALQRARSVTPGRVGVCLRPVVQLRRLTPFLTCGGLTFVPWGGRPVYRASGRGTRCFENATPRIPEPVIAAMLRWAIKYVEVFAADIFAARAELDALKQQFAARPRARIERPVAMLAARIEDRRRNGRGIPVWETPLAIGGITGALSRAGALDGQVMNLRLISMQCGLHVTTICKSDALQSVLLDAARQFGVEIGGMDTQISIDPDTGLPWRERFDALSLAREERHLQAAAYVVCAYLTGMRDGEVQALRPGCLKRSLNADGKPERFSVEGIIWKDRGARGEPAEWVTIEPAAHALEVADRLSARLRAKVGDGRLWMALDDRQTSNVGSPLQAARQINRFRDHLDGRYGSSASPTIPKVDGEAWRFNTRQFRRTLAWYIANRPFGAVAGKIQYKHASVAMFDGYAGSSASGFKQEVEQERALGQLDDIVNYYEARQRGQNPRGPAGLRIAAELNRVDHELSPLAGQIVDRKRVKAMLRHLARTLHVGYLNDCFFEPSTALCLKASNETFGPAPVLSRCAPDRCPNACISERHLPPWEASIAEAEELLKDKRLSSLQREALHHDNERKRKLIAHVRSGDAR
jgi:hypothetical protein